MFREDHLIKLLQLFAIERDASCVEEAGPKNKPGRGLHDHFRQLRTISSEHNMFERRDSINAPAMGDDSVPNFYGLEYDPSVRHSSAT